jgi:hypothetical protein
MSFWQRLAGEYSVFLRKRHIQKYMGWEELAEEQERRGEPIDEDEKQKHVTEWLLNSLDGVIEAICAKYF